MVPYWDRSSGWARDPGPGRGVLLLLIGPAALVVVVQILAGIGLLRHQLDQIRPGQVADALCRRPGVAGAGEIDHRHPGTGPAAAGTAGGISAVSGISGTAWHRRAHRRCRRDFPPGRFPGPWPRGSPWDYLRRGPPPSASFRRQTGRRPCTGPKSGLKHASWGFSSLFP